MPYLQQLSDCGPPAPALQVQDEVGFPKQDLRNYGRTVLSFGVTQIIIGLLCFCMKFILLILRRGWDFGAFGLGTCGGVVFFIAGLLGLLSGKNVLQKSLICATNVMSIIAACFALTTFSLGIKEMISYIFDAHKDENSGAGYEVCVVIEMILSFIEMIVAFASVALTCRVYLCCRSNNFQSNIVDKLAIDPMKTSVLIQASSCQFLNQPNPYSAQPIPLQNQPIPLQNQPIPLQNQPIPLQNQPIQLQVQLNHFLNPLCQSQNQPNQNPSQAHEHYTTPINYKYNATYTQLQDPNYEKINDEK